MEWVPSFTLVEEVASTEGISKLESVSVVKRWVLEVCRCEWSHCLRLLGDLLSGAYSARAGRVEVGAQVVVHVLYWDVDVPFREEDRGVVVDVERLLGLHGAGAKYVDGEGGFARFVVKLEAVFGQYGMCRRGK